MPDDHAVFENVPSSILQPKSAWCVLFGCVWRKPLVYGTASCLSVFCKPGETVPVLAGQNGIDLGCFKSAAAVPPCLNHTCREVPLCRWIASETNPAEPPRSMRYRPSIRMSIQFETSTTGLTLTQSSLFSLPKPRELLVKKCNLGSLRGSAPPLMLRTQVKGIKATRRRRVWAAPPSTSCFAVSRTESPQPRFCVTQSRSSCFWPVEE